MTTSDYDDPEIEENIAYNFRKNGLEPPPHLRRILKKQKLVHSENQRLAQLGLVLQLVNSSTL